MDSKGATRNRILSMIWWSKVIFAFLLSAGGLILLSYNVLLKHREGLILENPNVAKPITIDGSDPTCQATKSTLARIEPPAGGVYLGFDITWQDERPADVVRHLDGRIPAIFGAFMDIKPDSFDFNMLAYHGNLAQLQGSILLLTLQPNRDVGEMPQSLLDQVSEALAEINRKGVPVLLRYGHEMNGDWTSYGVRPVSFVRGFRALTNSVRKYTNMTAMVWGPNLGIQYPFNNLGQLTVVDSANRIYSSNNSNGQYPTITSDPVNFNALDTNGNGLIDVNDDPYSPYYPGNEYVDWVGLSLYYYADDDSTINQPIPPTYFVDHMIGSGPSIAGSDGNIFVGKPDRNFYDTYVARNNKPLIIPETAVPWHPARANINGGIPIAQLKQSWWNQVFDPNTLSRFPLMKAIVKFEEVKVCFSSQNTCDFRILHDESVRQTFVSDISTMSNLIYATQIGFDCAGQLSYKK